MPLNAPDRLPALTETIITNFTTLTGVVGFYFTSAAVVRVAETRAGVQSGDEPIAAKEPASVEQPVSRSSLPGGPS
jgi:hypothetical protein